MTASRRLLALTSFWICAAGCGDTPTPLDPAETVLLTAVSPTSIVATVGSAVTDLPAVFAQDSRGNPVAGVAIVFAVEGGGVVVGSTVTTSPEGIARLAGWTIRSTPGPNRVTAASGGVSPVTFTVTALVGPPRNVRKIAGDFQIAPRNQTVSVAPAVRVTDAYENPVPGTKVTFSIASGGGSITGADATTDSAGVAQLETWTLGTLGNQAVSARVGALDPVLFTATSRSPLGTCLRGRIPESGVIASKLDQLSCDHEGRYHEAFEVELTYSRWRRFAVASSEFDPVLELRDLEGRLIAVSDTTSSSFRVLAPAGSVAVVASTTLPGQGGNYRLEYGPGDEEANCDVPFVARGVSRMQQMIDKQCPNLNSFEDVYRIHLAANSTVTIRIDDWSYADPSVQLLNAKGEILAEGRQTGHYIDVLEFAASEDGYYLIRVASPYEEWIRYMLTVN